MDITVPSTILNLIPPELTPVYTIPIFGVVCSNDFHYAILNNLDLWVDQHNKSEIGQKLLRFKLITETDEEYTNDNNILFEMYPDAIKLEIYSTVKKNGPLENSSKFYDCTWKALTMLTYHGATFKNSELRFGYAYEEGMHDNIYDSFTVFDPRADLWKSIMQYDPPMLKQMAKDDQLKNDPIYQVISYSIGKWYNDQFKWRHLGHI